MHKDANESLCVISDERWPTYIKETETVFHNVPNIVEVIKSSKEFMWPSQMGQVIGFNKKVGEIWKPQKTISNT
jgi:hypothetical protein